MNEHDSQRRNFLKKAAMTAAALTVAKDAKAPHAIEELKILGTDNRSDLPEKFNALVDYIAEVERTR